MRLDFWDKRKILFRSYLSFWIAVSWSWWLTRTALQVTASTWVPVPLHSRPDLLTFAKRPVYLRSNATLTLLNLYFSSYSLICAVFSLVLFGGLGGVPRLRFGIILFRSSKTKVFTSFDKQKKHGILKSLITLLFVPEGTKVLKKTPPPPTIQANTRTLRNMRFGFLQPYGQPLTKWKTFFNVS